LVEFKKGALYPDCPSFTTCMTKEHMIYYNGSMYPAKSFVENFDVSLIPYTGEILYNVLLDTHSIMNVNGLICETLHPDNLIAKLYTKKCKFDISTRDQYAYALLNCLQNKDYKEYERILQFC